MTTEAQPIVPMVPAASLEVRKQAVVVTLATHAAPSLQTPVDANGIDLDSWMQGILAMAASELANPSTAGEAVHDQALRVA